MTPLYWDQMARSAREEHMLFLMTITHADLAEPVRVVNDTVSQTALGQTWQGWPLRFKFPGDAETGIRSELTIQNVSREIGDKIRVLKGTISVQVDLVYKAEPNAAVISLPGLRLRNVEVSATTVTGELTSFGSTAVGWPAGRATPARTPGLFA